MNVKLEFVIELPEELRAAMSLNGETGLCSWIEGGELHVRIMDDPPEIDDAYDEGFSEGTTQETKAVTVPVMPPDTTKD